MNINIIDTCQLDFGVHPDTRRSTLDVRRLGIPRVAKEFDHAISQAIEESDLLCDLSKGKYTAYNLPLDQCNTELTRIVNEVAEKSLWPNPRELEKKDKRSKERRDLFKLVHANHRVRRIDSLRQYNKLSDYPPLRRQLVQDLVQATRAYERANKEADRVEAEEALRKMSMTHHINIRLDLCFKFLKARKRSATTSCSSVTHELLELELDKFDHGPIKVLPQTDHIVMDPPPSLKEFGSALLTTRTGIRPGLDQLYSEYYHASPMLMKLTSKLMLSSYIQSQAPTSWSQTMITLIPKIPRPLAFEDLRPITLTPVAYKAYAKVLLERLQSIVGEIKPYQSGFLRNRSCDDQHFAQQRILETEWNHGRDVYMLSLDFTQAFSRVNLHKLAEVLIIKGVPHYFINLIINTCLTEETRFNWMGTVTSTKRKTVGVKQGCTIAPYLFVLTLDVILERVQKELREKFQLDLYLGEADRELALPITCAYADDMIHLARSLEELNKIMTVSVPIMREYGLELNVRKCHLVRKSPASLAATANSPTVCLGGLEIAIQKSVKVLGSTYGEDMNRRQMILARCTQTVRLFYAMRKHLQRCELSFDILVRLYKVVIAPVLLFGLRSVSITKSNQMILVRRELHILRSLAQLSSPPAPDAEVLKVLKGRTINRRLTVSRLVYHGHVTRSAAQGLLKKALDYSVNQPRKIGRPLFTYSKTIQNEMGSINEIIDHAEWDAALNSREKLKTLCERIYDVEEYPGDPMPFTAKLSDSYFSQTAR